MSELNRENFIGVKAWMVTDLGLQGDELLTYAIIFGFSQDGVGWYLGGRGYICNWLGCSEKKAGRILQSLYEKGLLVKESDKGKAGIRYRYQVKFSTIKEFSTMKGETNRDKTSLSSGQNVPINRDKTSHINTKGNNNLNSGYLENQKAGQFTPPPPIKCPECGSTAMYNIQVGCFECNGCYTKVCAKCGEKREYDRESDRYMCGCV